MTDRTPVEVVVYTRPGCSACVTLARRLGGLADAYGLVVREQNVDDDPAWAARYGLSVPVLEIGATVLAPPLRDSDLLVAIAKARRKLA